jgi:hypothetical protein
MIAALEPIFQKTGADCALAAMAMALGLSYRQVSDAALELGFSAHRRGLYTTQMMNLAKHLNRPLKKTAGVCETGILLLGRQKNAHAVAMFQGVLINPADGLLWDLDTFVKAGRWRVLHSLEESNE